MKTRAITGFFFIIVMLASVLLGHYVFGAFYLLLSVFCLLEFYSLVKQSGVAPSQVTGLFNGVAIYTIFALVTADAGFMKLILLLVYRIHHFQQRWDLLKNQVSQMKWAW